MLRPHLRLGVLVVLGAGLAAASPQPGFAQNQGAAAEALDAWVAELDASPDVDAAYDTLTGTGDQAVLTGLRISGRELIIEFDPIAVTGYRAVGPSGYAFASFTVDRIQARTPTTEVKVTGFAIGNLVVPETGNEYDDTLPLSSILDIWGRARQISIDEIAMDRIDIGQFAGGLNSLVSYHNFVVEGVGEGRIASTSAGPLIMESPSPDALFVITVDDLRSENIDFNAVAWVLDPAAYTDSDREWRTMLGHAEYRNIIVAAPDLQLRIRAIEIDDFRMRQAAEPFTPILERILTDPDIPALEAEKLTQEILVDLISPWGLGGFRIQGLDIYTDEVDRFHLGEFYLSDLSLDGLGEIGLADLDVVIGGQGYLRIGAFALGGLAMPDEAIIRRVLEITAAGQELTKIEEILPTLAFIELADFEFAAGATLPVTVDRLLIGTEGYLEALPTNGAFEVAGFNLPLSLVPDEVRRLLNQVGYTELIIDLGLYMEWSAATETLLFDNLHAAIVDAGSITASFEIGGVTREMFENLESLSPEQLLRLTFNWAEIRLVDEAVADRLFEWTAQGTNQPADQYRNEFIIGLPFLLGLTIDRAIAAEVGPPIQQFLREPSVLLVTARPAEPVPLVAMMAMVEESLWSLLPLLSVELTVEPLER
jgi:hypothetical protein